MASYEVNPDDFIGSCGRGYFGVRFTSENNRRHAEIIAKFYAMDAKQLGGEMATYDEVRRAAMKNSEVDSGGFGVSIVSHPEYKAEQKRINAEMRAALDEPYNRPLPLKANYSDEELMSRYVGNRRLRVGAKPSMFDPMPLDILRDTTPEEDARIAEITKHAVEEINWLELKPESIDLKEEEKPVDVMAVTRGMLR